MVARQAMLSLALWGQSCSTSCQPIPPLLFFKPQSHFFQKAP